MKVPFIKIQSFLRARGWSEAEEQQFRNKLALFRNERFPRRELSVPLHEDAPDYMDAIRLLLSKLAFIENRSIDSVELELERSTPEAAPESHDDFSIRIKTASNQHALFESIPLKLAHTSIAEAETILMAGSCMAQKPARYHRRLDNKYSNALLDRAVFNHTQHGSFILSISCPLLVAGEQMPIFSGTDDSPPARKALIAIHNGLDELSTITHDNRHLEFGRDTLASESPSVSANFVGAVANILSSSDGLPIDFSFEWSKLIPLADFTDRASPLPFSPSDAEKLYELAATLRPDTAPLTARFVGTVEGLSGDVTEGQRAGRVEFALMHPSQGLIRASAFLDIDQYRLADQAHISGSQFVAITGTVEPRARIWNFTAVSKFETVLAP